MVLLILIYGIKIFYFPITWKPPPNESDGGEKAVDCSSSPTIRESNSNSESVERFGTRCCYNDYDDGKAECIQSVFGQSKNRSVIIWTAIISAYASHGDVNAALGLFDEMLNEGALPDPVTFTAILTACAHSGVVDEAWRIFDSMLPKYGIQPSMEHYACMVGVLLSRARKLSEAKDFINKMQIEPSTKVWGALLNGASISGDVELGKFVCNHLFEIEPENTGNYIIMANLYSQSGRWEEA